MGEDVLFEYLPAEVGAGAVVPHPFGQLGRRGHPPEAQPGRQRLAHRAGQRHAARIDALQATDGVPVVAELGVVVVFDHEAVDVAGPLDERRPTGRRQHHARRILMGGRDQHDPGPRAGEGRDVDALAVDRDGHEVEPRAAQQGQLTSARRVLDGERALPVFGEQPYQDREPVRDPVRHDDLLRGHVGRPHPAQISGQLHPQRAHSGRIGVGQVGVRDRPQHVPGRGEPAVARERREVGNPGPQVIGQLRLGSEPGRLGSRRRPVRRGERRHPGALTAMCDQEAFGDELLVGGDHDAAGHDELLREITTGGQPRACDEPPGPDRRAQLGGDLIGKAPRCPIEMEMEVGHVSALSGPRPLDW
jgi:hypothetical protein